MIDECLLVLEKFYSKANAIDEYTLKSCHKIRHILDFEEQLSNRWTDFELLTGADWIDIRASIDQLLAGNLLVYGMRMAFLSVRSKKELGIWHGLMALVLDNDLLDYRDVLTIATLLYDGATLLGVCPDGLFQRAMLHATTRRSELLKGYLTAPSFTKSVESKGFERRGSGQDFVYEWRKF